MKIDMKLQRGVVFLLLWVAYVALVFALVVKAALLFVS
jgi:hypothetical protein